MAGIIELRDGDCRVAVSTAGGAILAAEVAGRPLLRVSRTPGLATRVRGSEACFPLVPFGGRIEGNGFRFRDKDYRLVPNTADPLVLHGDGWLREWTIASSSETSAILMLERDDGSHSPYAYRAMQRIDLLPSGVRLTLEVINLGSEALPFGLGFHPYLPIDADCSVQFEADAVWTEREMHLPGRRKDLDAELDFRLARAVPDIWINNCYEDWSGEAVIRHADHTITLSADPSLAWLMVYKPEGASDYLCLEPMSHRPNDQSKAFPLEPGASLRGSIMVEMTNYSFS